MQNYPLINRNLQEVINDHHLLGVLEKRERSPRGYWGTAPTGSIHIGYFCPLLKIKDLVEAGCHITILIADIHALLDNLKCPYEKIELRTKYYISMLKVMLERINVDVSKIEFVIGSSYQLTPEVTFDLLKLANTTTVTQAIKAGTDVVKQDKNPKLTSLIYPLLQALDEKYLKADFELGGVDQRKIFAYSIDHLESKCTYLLNPIVPGLSKGKMSASDVNSKIDILEKPEVIKSKIVKAFCADREVENNGILALFKNLVFNTIDSDKFTLLRPENYGGDVEFHNYQELEESFVNGTISSIDLKNNLTEYLVEFLQPIRSEFSKYDAQNLYIQAYWDS